MLTYPHSCYPNHIRGFTLIEVLVVLILVTLMMALVSPSLVHRITNSETRAAPRKLLEAIRYTRSQAIAKQQEMRMIVNTEEHTYYIPVRDKTIKLPEALQVLMTIAESEQIDKNSGSIRFFPDGSSTGGKIILKTHRRSWEVAISWLTGGISLKKTHTVN